MRAEQKQTGQVKSPSDLGFSIPKQSKTAGNNRKLAEAICIVIGKIAINKSRAKDF
jgi:hypothetical protein